MRVHLQSSHSSSNLIHGSRIHPSETEKITILPAKTLAVASTNYQNILDDGRNHIESSSSNILPINFCHTPGEYNKLLITNGRKGVPNDNYSRYPSVPTVEFLNGEVHKRNQEKQYKIKEIYLLKQSERLKSTKPQISDCNCCCCDNFCQVCSDQMHFNFDKQPVVSDVPRVSRNIKTDRGLKSPSRRVIDIEQREEWINKSQLSRAEKSKKRKLSGSFSAQEPESYQRIRPLLERSIQKQRRFIEHQHNRDPIIIAQQKISRVRSYDQQRKQLASRSISTKEFKPKQPWGYNQQKQKEPIDKYCHSHNHHDPVVKRFVVQKRKKQVEQQQYVLCHPHSSISPELMEVRRKHLGQLAHEKVNKQRQQKIYKKIKITQNLRRLQQQRKEIVRKAPKQAFKPPKGGKAFENIMGY